MDEDDLSYTIKHAIDMRWPAAIRLFLDCGADPNATHPATDETTLHWAVKRAASTDVIEQFFDAGGDPGANIREGVEVYDSSARTPYDFALRLGHRGAISAMAKRGACPSRRLPEDEVIWAIAVGDRDKLRELEVSHPDDTKLLSDADRRLAPEWAQQGAVEALVIAAKLGFDLSVPGWMGLTPMHWAAIRGDLPMVKALQQAKAPVVDLGGYFQTPLHCAQECQWWPDGDYSAVISALDH